MLYNRQINQQQLMKSTSRQSDHSAAITLVGESLIMRQQISKNSFEAINIVKQASQKKLYHQCLICENQYPRQVFSTFGCSHYYCKFCLQEYVKTKISSFQPIICCHQTCHRLIDHSPQSIYHGFSNSLKYQIDRLLDHYDRLNHIANCLLCQKGTLTEIVNQKKELICNKCSSLSCYNCFQPKHQGRCQFRRNKNLPIGCAICQRCQTIVFKSQGCNHIKCICSYEFCHECGFHWTNSHVCEHKITQRKGCHLYFCNFLKILFFPIIFIFFLFFFLFTLIVLSFVSSLLGSVFGIIKVGSILSLFPKTFQNQTQITSSTLTQIPQKQPKFSYLLFILYILFLPLIGIVCLIGAFFVPTLNICWKRQIVLSPRIIDELLQQFSDAFDIYLII